MTPVKIGCIGKSLKHSYSAKLHKLLSAEYDYSLWELENEAELDSFMKRRDFSGINVTIPYKKSVIPYLDELTDTAKSIGAVNTIYKKDGRLFGDNTDYFGLSETIKKHQIGIKNKKILILGTGGTSETAICLFRDMGAKSVVRASRGKTGEGVVSYEEAYCQKDTEVVINTTPCGMFPDIEGTPVNISEFPNLSGVVDCIYNPFRTNLIIDAERRKIPTASGLYMLVKQGQRSSEIFLNCKYDGKFISRIFHGILGATQNLVLIGMPGCGKTTIGKAFSNECVCEFIDTDCELEKEFGMSIADYFAKNSEKAFRERERNLICEKLKYKTSCIIATGGGSVLNPDNVKALKRNSKLIFLKKSREKLVMSDSRPLSSDKERLDILFSQRESIYESVSDMIIDIDDLTVKESTDKIKEAIKNEYEKNTCD